jgi:hypothetical protein
VVLVLLVFVYAIFKFIASRKGHQGLDLGQFHEAAPPPPPPPDLRLALASTDPAFSEVLFTDFVYALYARAQLARHDARALAALGPWIDEPARTALAARSGSGPVTAVIIGSMQILQHSRRLTQDYVRVAFEVNQLHGDRTYYLVEQWLFFRRGGVKSRAWKGAVTFDCPSCAAPQEKLDGGRCQHCGEIVDGGRFDWLVKECTQVSVPSERGPQLTGTVEEQGTGGPTLFDPGLRQSLSTLAGDDPEVNAATLGARMKLIYQELNRGWNAQDPRVIRPVVSDGMMAYLVYWLDAYKGQGLTNRLENATLDTFTVAKVRRDPAYDAVTLRFWATGADVTLDREGRVVGGSKTKKRQYSEYWTLIRGAGVKGKPRADRGCPNCGAELVTGMGGSCDHCGAHVTRGEFDWVLSRIEQDEAYRG